MLPDRFFAEARAFVRRHAPPLLVSLYFALVVTFDGPLSRDIQIPLASGLFGWALAHVLAAIATIRFEGHARTAIRHARAYVFDPSPISREIALHRCIVFGGELMAIEHLADLYRSSDVRAECDANMDELCTMLDRLEAEERAEAVSCPF